MSSLYERLGGEAAVNAAVDLFYRKVLVDDKISHFFDGVDMDAQIAKQKSFLTMVFGGPNHYSGKGMRDAHQHMALNNEHFAAVVANLAETLTELGVAEEDIAEVAKIAESVKGDVLDQ